MTIQIPTKDSIIIFYRTNTNAEESLTNQQAFLKAYKEQPTITAIDYASDDNFKTLEIFELIRNQSGRFIVITQSSLSKEEFNDQYEHYKFFDFYQKLGRVELYLMDSFGKLYRQVGNIIDKERS